MKGQIKYGDIALTLVHKRTNKHTGAETIIDTAKYTLKNMVFVMKNDEILNNHLARLNYTLPKEFEKYEVTTMDVVSAIDMGQTMYDV